MPANKLKRLIKSVLPPVLTDLAVATRGALRKSPQDEDLHWTGDYASWEDATQVSTGYDANVIFQTTARSILMVKNGQARFERDSVVMDQPEYSWPLIALLLKVATDKKSLHVLDFGGSLGSTYFQTRNFFESVSPFHWSVVEQEHYIKYGNEEIGDDHLHFYFTVDDCVRERPADVLLLSGVIQCLDDPYKWLAGFVDKGIENVIFDRTAFIDDSRDRLTVQHVPSSIYKASYPAWFLNKDNIVRAMSEKYELVEEFTNGITPDVRLDGKRGYWAGLYFKLKL